MILWIKFLLCSLIILFFGLRLSKTAYRIAETGRFSEGFIGIFFLAMITSFPEIFTSIGSVTKVYAPDLAVGDLVGSVIFNFMIIAILDFRYGKDSILSTVGKTQLISCGFLLLILGVLISSLSLHIFTSIKTTFFNISIESPFIILMYIFAILYTYKYGPKIPKKDNSQSLPMLYMAFAMYGIVIIVSGFWLASLGKAIVDNEGWNEMYFGTIIIALSTSLPEIVVSFRALSIGSADMAIANILGSNLFDLAIIPVIDFLFHKGSIFNYISYYHIYSCLFAIMLTLIIFGSILYKPRKTFMRMSIGVVLMIFMFVVGNFILYNILN